MKMRYFYAWVLVALIAASCKGTQAPKHSTAEGAADMGLTITSAAFKDGEAIPKKFSCDGQDLSPALLWSGVPAGTKSFALICDDPDAPMGTWVHWVAWGIPADATSLPEGAGKSAEGIKQGMNSWPRAGYSGPCPPPGKPHRYYFKLFELDSDLELPQSANKAALETAMKGHILGQSQTMGTYQR
jgi:Raf kinase inhibitor-like YbhB/YbcL family protein